MTVRVQLTESDVAALVLIAEMYGMQLDQFAAALGVRQPEALQLATRWRLTGLVQTEPIGPGPLWIWLTRPGMTACGLRYLPRPPSLSRIAHLRAVTAVRLALAGTIAYREAGAVWRCERGIRIGYRGALRDHLPDGEVHWPSGADLPWAGECWAIEAELTRKSVARTAVIMRELLLRTGEYGCPAADAVVPGRPPRHARVVYLCSSDALTVVGRARAELGPLAARVEIRSLPPGAGLRS